MPDAYSLAGAGPAGLLGGGAGENFPPAGAPSRTLMINWYAHFFVGAPLDGSMSVKVTLK